MSDKEHSPAASPRHEDDNDSRSPKSPRAGSASPKSAAGDDNEGASSAENAGRRATSRSPSPAGSAAAAAAAKSERVPRTEPDAANPGNNLYIANLPERLSQSEMEEMFAKFGRVEKCEVICDPVTRESRGFGFVSYEDVRDATDAVTELNGKEIQGRRIRVEHAKRQRGHEKTPGKYLGPRQASTKYGVRGSSGRSRSRSRDRERFRPRSRSRSRDRGRRYDSRDRYDRRYDDRGRGYDRDRYERRSRR